jgi:hypothetical protein
MPNGEWPKPAFRPRTLCVTSRGSSALSSSIVSLSAAISALPELPRTDGIASRISVRSLPTIPAVTQTFLFPML